MNIRLVFLILAFISVQASASFATDLLGLLAQVSHLQQKKTGEDLAQIAEEQRALIIKKKKMRQIQENYQQALRDKLQDQEPELGNQLQVLVERFKILDQEWDQAFGETIKLWARANQIDLDNAEPEEEEPIGAVQAKTKTNADEDDEEEVMPMFTQPRIKAKFQRFR